MRRRILAILGAGLGLTACYEPDLRAPDAGVSDATSDDATSDDASSCAEDPAPTGVDCPAACTGDCFEGVCLIDCASRTCNGTITCPPELACHVVCDGADACDTAMVLCPELHACTVTCGGGGDACGDVIVQCAGGSCLLECASNACSGASLSCGSGSCAAVCEGTPTPGVACGADSCACTPC